MAGYGQSWDLNPGPWALKHNLSALQDRALGSGRAGGTLSSLALLVVASHCKVAEQEPAERCNRGRGAEVFLNEPTNVGTRKQQADHYQIQRRVTTSVGASVRPSRRGDDRVGSPRRARGRKKELCRHRMEVSATNKGSWKC